MNTDAQRSAAKMTNEYFDLGEKLMGLERPPPGPRHFLPPVVGEFEIARPRPCIGFLFDGYDDANRERYLVGNSEGSCLDPDLPGGGMVAIDPQLHARGGDIGLITIRLQGFEYECLKHVQARDGCLWACSNDGDFPLSGRFPLCGHVHSAGRLVYALVPINADNVASYHQNLARFFEVMADPGSNAAKALDALAGSVVPAGLAALDRVTDPNKREVYSLIDAIRARTPGASEKLPPLRNLWGEPVPSGSGMGANFDLFSPFGTRAAANEPIDAELLRQQIDLARTPSRTAIHGVTLDLNRIDPRIYSRFQELAGNGYKGPDGLGLKDALNALVTGNHPYSPTYARLTDGPDGSKADMLRDIVSEYRNGAKEQLLAEYAGTLGPMVEQGIAAKQFLKAGAQ